MRVLIPIAVLIVLAGVVYVSIKIGITIGKARQRRAQDAIDPVLHAELAHFARTVLAPPNTVDDVVVLPGWMRKQLGDPLVQKLDTRPATVRRADNRPYWQLPS
jgi:hypothetical protein